MSVKFIIFILIHLAALVYFIEVLRRVANKVKEYNLKDTSQTLPFGFVRLRYVVVLYVVAYLIWVFASILAYLYFVNGNLASFGIDKAPDMIRGFDLNL